MSCASDAFIHKAKGCVEVLSRDQTRNCPRWAAAFRHRRKDYRFYEILEETVCPEFSYRYFAIRDSGGEIIGVQPFFILDQDLLLGASPRWGAILGSIRKFWPRFMVVRTLMVGCAAGEGHLDNASCEAAQLLASQIVSQARALGASLVVLKEFPAAYRPLLQCFVNQGFARVPSLPMTRLNIDYASFGDYMRKALKSSTRAKLRRKFQAAEKAAPIEMEIVSDISPVVDEIYPLYLQTYRRSKLHFEKLSEAFFRKLGREMPEKVRFFLWRQEGKIVCFTLCMIEGDCFHAEYIGLDYSVALELHLYHYAVRDMIEWAIAHGFKWFCSSALNYDPKLQMRHLLDPVDLYVRHTSGVINPLLKRILPLLEPVRYDRTLQKFPNYKELWAG
jgi:hypothetical protein